jgi:hypothetical protein
MFILASHFVYASLTNANIKFNRALNSKRKSTVGWSLANVLLDATGGACFTARDPVSLIVSFMASVILVFNDSTLDISNFGVGPL